MICVSSEPGVNYYFPTSSRMQEIFDACRHLFILMWTWAFLPCIFTSLVAAERSDADVIGTVGPELNFHAYRLQQYEMGGRMYGSTSWRILYEAVALNRSALRKCVIASWRDLLEQDLETSIIAAVGAVLVIIPEDVNALTDKEKEELMRLESKFANIFTGQAIYFAPHSETLNYLLKSVSLTSTKSPTAFQQLYNAVAANSFQLTSENTASTNVITTKQYNVIGQLNAVDPGRPYFVIVAHYDSHAVIPALSKGFDSNGSGVAALLEILAILSQFYVSSPTNRPKFNIVFLLSAAGKFNYQGSRQWIDVLQEQQPNAKVAFALCLDGLATGQNLNFHVAKAPSEGSVSQKLFNNLKSFANADRNIQLVSKKIVKGMDNLAWEHEVFNLRRMHAATVSHFDMPTDPMRNSILDNKSTLDKKAFQDNVATIANAVTSFIFDLDPSVCDSAKAATVNASTGGECSLVGNSFNPTRLVSWLDAFASSSRSIMALNEAESSRLVANLRTVVQNYADKTIIAEVPLIDLTLSGIMEDKLSASVVKPAVFELFLAAIIGVYLFGIYVVAQNAQSNLERSILVMKRMT